MSKPTILCECPCQRYFALKISHTTVTIQRNEASHSVEVMCFTGENREQKARDHVQRFHARLCK